MFIGLSSLLRQLLQWGLYGKQAQCLAHSRCPPSPCLFSLAQGQGHRGSAAQSVYLKMGRVLETRTLQPGLSSSGTQHILTPSFSWSWSSAVWDQLLPRQAALGQCGGSCSFIQMLLISMMCSPMLPPPWMTGEGSQCASPWAGGFTHFAICASARYSAQTQSAFAVGHTYMCLVAQSCLTLCDPMDCSLPGSSVHVDSPGKNTGVGCHALLQGIFPTQGLNPGLLQCRQILIV